MYGHTDGRTEFLPILQDFVPSQGCCPKIVMDQQTNGPTEQQIGLRASIQGKRLVL